MFPGSQMWVGPHLRQALLKPLAHLHPAAGSRCGWLGNQPAEDLAEPGEPQHPNIA